MAAYEIKNLQELIAPISNNSQIVKYSITNLTSAGDNYGSAIFSIEIALKKDDEESKIRAVAKMLPQNKFIQKMFNSPMTFKNEAGFYRTIAPCLREFQKENGVKNVFSSYPDFYAARNSLTGDKVDGDAVLLIKNIKDDGYNVMDRKVGFDLNQSKVILGKLAELHATVAALKITKPAVFEKELGQFFHQFTMFKKDDDDDGAESALKMIDSIFEFLKHDEFCVENTSRIRDVFLNNIKFGSDRNRPELQQTPFASFVHSDLWTNNIMVKEVDGRFVDVKFVDFQIYEYSSILRDVIFFLFSSVQLPVAETSLDELIAFYFDSFISWMKDLNCDVSVYKLEDFLKEMGDVVKRTEFFHVMLMLRPIYALHENTKEVDKLEIDDFVDNKNDVGEMCKLKGSFIVREFIKREWI